MPSRLEFIAELRTWDGTPYRHLGRIKGVQADCIGVLLCTARAVGLFPPGFDITGYKPLPDPSKMRALLDANMIRIASADALPGDIAYGRDFEHGGAPRHLAGLTERGTIIHAHSNAGNTDGKTRTIGRVLEQGFNEKMRARVVQWYRFRGIQ